MRVLVRWALLALCLACPFADADERQERALVRGAVKKAYTSGDYDTLERLHAQYSDFLHQRTASGASKMGPFMDGLGEGGDATDALLKRDIARAERWSQVHPDSAFGYILHAETLKIYAHFVRGGGYAGSVKAEAWPVFRDYNQRALKVLTDHLEVASRSTSWHAEMIVLGRDEQWEPEAMNGLFEEGIKRDPTDYRLYHYMVNSLLPKWGGDTRRLDAFIRGVSARAPTAYGMELYARLYSGVEEEQFPGNLYSDSLADWSLMKAGLRAWVQHFPTAWNTNIFAYHACLAGDKPAARPLFAEIADHPDPEIWNVDVSPTFDECRRWVAEPTVASASPAD